MTNLIAISIGNVSTHWTQVWMIAAWQELEDPWQPITTVLSSYKRRNWREENGNRIYLVVALQSVAIVDVIAYTQHVLVTVRSALPPTWRYTNNCTQTYITLLVHDASHKSSTTLYYHIVIHYVNPSPYALYSCKLIYSWWNVICITNDPPPPHAFCSSRLI